MSATTGTVPVADGYARFTGRDRRLRVLLLTSDDPQHDFLRRAVAADLHLVGTIVEPGAAQRRRLRCRRRWRDALVREYHRFRQRLTGRAAYRHAYFDGLARAPGGTDHGDDAPRHVVDSMNDEHTRALVRAASPDLTIVCGTGVLGTALVEATPGLMVNVHGGWLPDYKGNHGVYFAFRNADWDRVGATVHVLTTELDAGAEIAKVVPDIYPHDNDEHVYLRAVQAAVLAAVDVGRRLERGESVAVRTQEDRGVTYRHRDRTPAGELRLWVRRRLGRHPVPHREGTS